MIRSSTKCRRSPAGGVNGALVFDRNAGSSPKEGLGTGSNMPRILVTDTRDFRLSSLATGAGMTANGNVPVVVECRNDNGRPADWVARVLKEVTCGG